MLSHVASTSLPSAGLVSALPTPLADVVCSACGTRDQPRLVAGSGPHYAAARCAHCDRFVRWISRHSPEEQAHRRAQGRLQAMASTPPTAPQLAYLRALHDPQPPPATAAEASARIDQLRQGRRQA
jgi:hypothetical protein